VATGPTGGGPPSYGEITLRHCRVLTPPCTNANGLLSQRVGLSGAESDITRRVEEKSRHHEPPIPDAYPARNDHSHFRTGPAGPIPCGA
jgi:hypothetical protein